jgi:hypothetical protein
MFISIDATARGISDVVAYLKALHNVKYHPSATAVCYYTRLISLQLSTIVFSSSNIHSTK